MTLQWVVMKSFVRADHTAEGAPLTAGYMWESQGRHHHYAVAEVPGTEPLGGPWMTTVGADDGRGGLSGGGWLSATFKDAKQRAEDHEDQDY